MGKHMFKRSSRSRGYTLMELLTVIGIIAITCAIAIPSVFAAQRALSFRQVNDYAESVFLAAQTTLTQLRSQGQLGLLQGQLGSGSGKVTESASGFPEEDPAGEYEYTVSGQSAFEMLLPPGSIDETIRSKNILIEYNPVTGNVYSVFFSKDPDFDIGSAYTGGSGLPRDYDQRKPLVLGYYNGSGLLSTPLAIEGADAFLTYENGQECIVSVHIPVPAEYLDAPDEYARGMQIDLTVTGEFSELHGKNPGECSYQETVKTGGQLLPDSWDLRDGSLIFTYTLDSLCDGRSFVNLSSGTAPSALSPGKPLSAIADESEFRILPGENVTLIADVVFQNPADRPAVKVRPGILAGVNPLYGYLLPSPVHEGKFILSVDNGRNLQNLNLLAPTLSSRIESVVFTDDINWAATSGYYNVKYGGTGKTYHNRPSEAPGRSLPNFVSIRCDQLLSTALVDGSGKKVSNLSISSPDYKVPVSESF